MTKFILHAGLHKTATTSLQEQVFPNVREAFYTGKSRQVMGTRKSPVLSQFLSQYKDDRDALSRIPLHTCIYYLSLLQDRLIARLARSKATLSSLQKQLLLMQSLVERISILNEKPQILYSCEGLLLCLGHLFPEQALDISDKAPLFFCKSLFPGQIEKIVIYVRSPIEYLFSRYIQIHTVRIKASPRFAMAPADYLRIQAQLFRASSKCQSVFYHIFQRELGHDLLSLDIPVVMRSYEKHIKNAPSISREIKKSFGLTLLGADDVDHRFKQQPLNTTDRDKDDAINVLINHMQLANRDELKQAFLREAEQNDLVQAALSSRVYPY